MWKPKTLAALLVVLPVLAPAASAADTRDPAAVAIARRTLDAMGGAAGFEKLRTLKFDFVVVRGDKEAARFRHVWDRWNGRYRLEGKDRAGRAMLVLFDVNQRGTGRAWADGKELAGDELKAALDWGYGRFINDTYWFLMPAKMLDPGVSLALEPSETKDGKAYDVVRLTFADVGLTPQDTYWAYVAKDTGLMERWEMVLTGQTPADRSAYVWTAWTQVGPVKLSLLKTKAPDGAASIRFENVTGLTTADDAAFKAP